MKKQIRSQDLVTAWASWEPRGPGDEFISFYVRCFAGHEIAFGPHTSEERILGRICLLRIC